MLLVTTGSPAPIYLQLWNGDTDRYPQAYVADSTGTPIATVDLVHQSYGRYTGAFTPATNGYYYASFRVFTDAAHTTEDLLHTDKTDIYRAGPIDSGGSGPALTEIYDIDMTTALNHSTNVMEFLVWADLNNDTIENPDSADLSVYDGAGSLIFTFPTNLTPTAQGVFKFVKISAQTYIQRDKTYLTSVTITKGAKTFQRLRSFTVF